MFRGVLALMTAYYNEIDPYAAQWLRNLITAGLIAPGDVDERSVVDVSSNDLAGYDQCHFFAGIGLWSAALRRAGWPDDRPVWTGSCPCQPFSGAGKGGGFDDDRHLWPEWERLISECGPRVVFGEQVANKDGLAWLDLVQTDLEAAGYASGAVDLCAAGFGSPNIRQRIWIVAERVGDAGGAGLQRHAGNGFDGDKPGRVKKEADRSIGKASGFGCHGEPGPTNGKWAGVDWVFCEGDGWRPVEPGLVPMANGDRSRVGRLRAYGNGINVEVASEFIKGVAGYA